MEDASNTIDKINDKDKISYIERNGKTFMIIEHFSEGQTYTDIIKNALRREFESDRQILQNGQGTCFSALFVV